MMTVCEKNQCNGCMSCIDICPKSCITIADDLYSYNAMIDSDICFHCNQCRKMCPNNYPLEKKKSIEWKQGWAEWKIRKNSASGGAASAVIRSFIESGGYVASCLFRDGKFLFDITNDIGQAKKFAGSKYVKSNPAGIYRRVAERVKTDKVLFIGLPCQVAAVKNYIENQENLYTMDLICHGTPSPKILEQYLLENGYRLSELADIRFRDKSDFGLRSKSIAHLENGRDSYLIAFLKNIDYTQNCYSCQYANADRVSDLTLGDSWGTDLKHEEKNGISLILVQTEKGNELLECSELVLREVNYEKAVNANRQLVCPPQLRPERDIFLRMITNGNTIKQATIKTLKKDVIKQRMKYLLLRTNIAKVGAWKDICKVKGG